MTTVTEADTDAVMAGDRPDRTERLTSLVQRHGGEVVLVVVVIAAAIGSNGFVSSGNLRAILVNTAYTSLLALGMTFVIMTGGIDLSVGSVFALGGVLAAYGAGHGGWLWALALPLLVCGGIGLLQGWLVARVGLAPFIVTLAGMLGARGLLQAISDNGTTTYIVPDGSFFAEVRSGLLAPGADRGGAVRDRRHRVAADPVRTGPVRGRRQRERRRPDGASGGSGRSCWSTCSPVCWPVWPVP